jgi:hypothetical protein
LRRGGDDGEERGGGDARCGEGPRGAEGAGGGGVDGDPPVKLLSVFGAIGDRAASNEPLGSGGGGGGEIGAAAGDGGGPGDGGARAAEAFAANSVCAMHSGFRHVVRFVTTFPQYGRPLRSSARARQFDAISSGPSAADGDARLSLFDDGSSGPRQTGRLKVVRFVTLLP